MAEQTLIVRIPVTDLDPDWTPEMLQDNAVLYLDTIIGQAEQRNEAEFGKPAYRLGEATVWTEENFAADLRELGEKGWRRSECSVCGGEELHRADCKWAPPDEFDVAPITDACASGDCGSCKRHPSVGVCEHECHMTPGEFIRGLAANGYPFADDDPRYCTQHGEWDCTRPDHKEG